MSPGPGDATLDVLSRVPLLAGLTPDERAQLAMAGTERRVAKGSEVWAAGDPGDELLVILAGTFAVTTAAGAHVALLGPGECVGELAVLLDEARSAGLTCAREGRVLAIDKPTFRRVVRDQPKALAHLTELLGRRARSLVRGDRSTPTTIVVGVIAPSGAAGVGMVSAVVAAVANRLVPTVAVRIVEGTRRNAPKIPAPAPGPGGVPTVEVEAAAAAVPAVVERALAAHGGPARLIVVSVDYAGIDPAPFDVTIAVVGSLREVPVSPSPGVHHVVNAGGAEVAPSLNSCSPYVLPHAPSFDRLDTEAQVHEVLALPRSPTARVLGRLARKLLGATVGLALGGGAAFGIAHVGILLALEEADLPVDLVAGTSMGSIIAIAAAAGLSAPEMVEIARRIGNVRTTVSVLDPTLSGAGLLSGRRLTGIFSPLLAVERFDQLTMPCRVVAMDVETGERVDIGTGRLDDAFRASCSIPLVFAPVRRNERTLVDGAMIDPVPVDVAREMGADLVVGVNVVPRLQRGVSTALSRTFKTVSRLNPLTRFGAGKDLPDLVDVLMNSLQVVQYELGDFKQLAADVRTNVELSEFTWIEFYKALDIIERGHEAGQHTVEQLRQVLDRRISTGA